MIYRKIPNISPVRIDIFKRILDILYSAGLIFWGVYIRMAFCASTCTFKTLKSIIISMDIHIIVKKELSLSQSHLHLPVKDHPNTFFIL